MIEIGDTIKIYLAQVSNLGSKNNIPQGGPKGAVRLIEKISKGCIITTNYDHLIEGTGIKIEGYKHGCQEEHNFVSNLTRGDRCLLKLHGDCDTPSSYIFTKTHYDQHYGNPFDYSKQLPKALRQIFISHSLLFLGCSLGDDYTLKLFKDVVEMADFEIPDHYTILQDPGTPELRNEEESRLLGMNIRPIWYPKDEHKYVELLLNLAIDINKGVIFL